MPWSDLETRQQSLTFNNAIWQTSKAPQLNWMISNAFCHCCNFLWLLETCMILIWYCRSQSVKSHLWKLCLSFFPAEHISWLSECEVEKHGSRAEVAIVGRRNSHPSDSLTIKAKIIDFYLPKLWFCQMKAQNSIFSKFIWSICGLNNPLLSRGSTQTMCYWLYLLIWHDPLVWISKYA